MLIDAHVHLDKYGDRLDDALKEIANEKIFTVATAMDVPSYLELQEIGKRSNLVLPTFGIHPRRAAEYADRLPEISRYIESSPAIGEIGLDFHWVKDTSTYPAQRKVLEYFIAAAAEQNKFVNLHTKAGEKEILDLLEKYDVQPRDHPLVLGANGHLARDDRFRLLLHHRRRSALLRLHQRNRQSGAGSFAADRNRQPGRTEMVEEK